MTYVTKQKRYQKFKNYTKVKAPIVEALQKEGIKFIPRTFKMERILFITWLVST